VLCTHKYFYIKILQAHGHFHDNGPIPRCIVIGYEVYSSESMLLVQLLSLLIEFRYMKLDYIVIVSLLCQRYHLQQQSVAYSLRRCQLGVRGVEIQSTLDWYRGSTTRFATSRIPAFMSNATTYPTIVPFTCKVYEYQFNYNFLLRESLTCVSARRMTPFSCSRASIKSKSCQGTSGKTRSSKIKIIAKSSPSGLYEF